MIRQDTIAEEIKVLHPTASLDGLSKPSRSPRDVKEPPSVVNVCGDEVNVIPIDGSLRHRTLSRPPMDNILTAVMNYVKIL